jgi:hypothetical protein
MVSSLRKTLCCGLLYTTSPTLWSYTKVPPTVSWTDHARDLLLLINHFRAEMPQPLVGIGHSYGGNQMYGSH